MASSTLLRIIVSAAGIFLIGFVLLISVTRQALYAPTAEELAARREISIGQRFEELATWPPAPDNPLYPLRMAHDQVRLLLTPKKDLAGLQTELATDRLDSAEKLLARRRLSLALTTLTKSTKYVLAAAATMDTQTPKSSNAARAKIAQAIGAQKEALVRLKPSFSDEQKSVIDRLTLELNALQEQFL